MTEAFHGLGFARQGPAVGRCGRALRFVSVISVCLLASVRAFPAPEWRHAINHDLKLHGGVLLGDERGTCWDDRLPEGWLWLGPPNTPFEPPGPDYLNCDQLGPIVEGGTVVFEASKWNFLQSALNRDVSEIQLGRRLMDLAGAKTFRFSKGPGLSAATDLFDSLDVAAAKKAIESPVESVPIPLTDYGVLVIRVASGKIFKALVENYSGTVAVTWAAIEGEGPVARFGAKTVAPGRRKGEWQRDFDGDGRPDLGWSAKAGDRHAPLGGATMAMVKVLKYP